MNTIAKHLPEIADELFTKGFSVTIHNSHRMIAVSLNRPISYSEIEHALGYEIASTVRFGRYNGRVIISE